MTRMTFVSVPALLALAVAAIPCSAQTTAAAVAAAATAPAASGDVPVTRVVLFSSGVGYFEHNGSVAGSVSADLRFETAQINDVLKSLVVYDRGGGSVRTITYPANDPVNRTLRSFQVNLSDDPPLADILKQIRGAPVSIQLADNSVSGTILGVESRDRTVGHGDAEKTIKTWFVNVITAGGIQSVALEDIRNLDIRDEKIKKEMGQALAALVQARDQSKKTVTIHFDGAGTRAVGMGYLVETPIWKPTYRLLLPDPTSKSPAELQAWAIVENQTDNDWSNVTLSLVGGRPISYIELLYQPLYVARPVVQPSIVGNIVPQTYDNGITPDNAAALGGIRLNQERAGAVAASPVDTGVPGSLARARNNINMGGQGLFGDTSELAPGTPSDFAQGVAAIAEATKIGEMFHYTVDKVTLPRQQSSMIPIVAEGVTVDRLSIYSPSVSVKYAMRGVRLHNRTGKYFLAGPVTVMDTTKDGHSYAGDAKIEDIPAGQSRLLTYAIDQDALIQISRDDSDESILTGSVVKGVLWLKYRNAMQREYTLQNKSDNPKTIIIEHPTAENFELKTPTKAAEKTDRVYRFEISLAPHETQKFPVVLERTRDEQMAITGIQADPLAYYVQQGPIPDSVRKMLSTVTEKRAAIADLERRKTQRDQDRTQILQEQGNIRENIRVLPSSSKSQADAIADLAAKDADLKAANKDLKDLAQSLESARNDLATYIGTTTIE
jgi:hypothetical protein